MNASGFRQMDTLLLVTHNREMAAQASRVISLRDGKIVDDTVLAPRTEPSKLEQLRHDETVP